MIAEFQVASGLMGIENMDPLTDLKAILHSKRANIYYLEYCRVMQKDGRVLYLSEAKNAYEYWNIPIANTTCILLGTGTSITQAAHLMAVHDNIKDLMTPFQKKDYYTPAMKGSYSIKYVLPALVPEMEKAYKELALVHNGGEAMQAYANMTKMNDEDKEKYRESLLRYCELDTLAMVKVLDKLKE